MPSLNDQAVLDAITELADQIARISPECADRAARLVSLAGQLRAAPIDRGTIQDAMESEALGSDLSDSEIRMAADAVVRRAREEL